MNVYLNDMYHIYNIMSVKEDVIEITFHLQSITKPDECHILESALLG